MQQVKVQETLYHKTYYTLQTRYSGEKDFFTIRSYNSLNEARKAGDMQGLRTGEEYKILQNTEIVLPTVEIERKVKG